MAITDNSFTPEEFKAAIDANKDLVTALQTGGYYVRDKAGEDAYAASLEDVYNKNTVELIKTTTGIEPIDKESPKDYASRVLNTTVEERNAAKVELDTLKGQSNITDYERQQIKDLQKLVNDKTAEIDGIKTTSANEVTKAKLENSVISQMNTVTSKFVKDTRVGVTKAIELRSSQVLEEIMGMAQKDSRNQIILIGEDKKAIVNKDGSFKTVAQFYEEKMDEDGFVDNGKEQPGAGGNDPGGKAVNVPGNCKTQVELMDFLRENTMKGKSQAELIKEFDKYAHLLPR